MALIFNYDLSKVNTKKCVAKNWLLSMHLIYDCIYNNCNEMKYGAK